LNFGCGSQDIFSHLLVSASNEWKYGTGDGAHNPIVCQSFIRYLCEAVAGEFEADNHLKKIIRSLVGIKPIA
jgi:hypothetical protein